MAVVDHKTIELPQGFKGPVTLTITERQSDGTYAPVDLTGKTVTVIVKASRTAADGTGKTYDNGVATGITIPLPATSGMVTIAVQNSGAQDVTSTAGNKWWKVVVSDATTNRPYGMGPFNVLET